MASAERIVKRIDEHIHRPSRDEVLSLEVLARSTDAEAEAPGEFRVLVRHFLDCFFSSELASLEGDAKTRLVQAACAIGIPGFVVALYLYTPYHMPHQVRPYWAQAGDHYFYVLYAMVAMGVVTIFEWDMLFPDLIEVYVLSTLPVSAGRLLRARVTAICILVAAALFDSSFLAPLVLPAATDPPHLLRFLGAHLSAVAASGVFGAAFFLAIEGVLLGVLGDRVFRKIALWLQGFFVMALLTLLFLYGVVAGSMHGLLVLGSGLTRWLPPFWFLGIYERILHGSSTLPVFVALARTGWAATGMAVSVAVTAYPIAWWRKTRGLVEGAVRRDGENRLGAPLNGVLHRTVARAPVCRAVWHFISQNLVRVPRYRMVLVMYGGMGAALVFATVTRVMVLDERLSFVFSPYGLRATIPVVAFWTVSGLRTTFLAPADQRGRWIFRVIVGKAGGDELDAAERWVLAWSLLLTLGAAAWACIAGAGTLHGGTAVATQILVAFALCLLLTDAFFLQVTTIPFTGRRTASTTNFALLLIPYLGFFPAIVMFTIGLEGWIESSVLHWAIVSAVVLAAHIGMRAIRKARIAEHVQQIDGDEDQEEFPLRLGLRY